VGRGRGTRAGSRCGRSWSSRSPTIICRGSGSATRPDLYAGAPIARRARAPTSSSTRPRPRPSRTRLAGSRLRAASHESVEAHAPLHLLRDGLLELEEALPGIALLRLKVLRHAGDGQRLGAEGLERAPLDGHRHRSTWPRPAGIRGNGGGAASVPEVID